jgi:arginine decarboxylase
MSLQLESPPTSRHAPFAGSEAPLVELLERYRDAGTVPFSGPGHKRGAGTAPEFLDLVGAGVFASDVWLDTASFDRALRAAQALAADAWGSDACFFLGNGSSSGNHAFLLGTVGPGDLVVVARDLHKSLLAALILSGASPVWVAPRLHPDLGVSLGVHPDDVAAALDAHPGARLVAVTSPNYFGVAADLPALVAAAHDRRVPVYVDEAWGPHLGFHPRLPASAMAAGADAAVTSTHKLLSSLSQSSILNLRWERLAAGRVEAAVKLTQTTSPLLPLLASIDACRRQLAGNGRALLERALELAAAARGRLRRLPGLEVLDGGRLGLGPDRFDPTKLVVDVTGLGVSGLAAERALRDRLCVAPEGSDLASVICMVTLGDSPASVDQLVGAFTALCAERVPVAGAAPPRSCGSVVAPGPQAMTPRDAFFAPARPVALAGAAGQVAAELVTPYPPGIPVLVPGERITDEKLAYLDECRRRGVHLRGPADPALAAIRVVAAAERSEPSWTTT